MDSWKAFGEATLPPKEVFHSNLNIEDSSNEDYTHAQNIWDLFETKFLGEYHDLYVKSDTLLLANASENFRNMCLEIWASSCIFLVCTRISMASLLKKDRSKIRINNRL